MRRVSIVCLVGLLASCSATRSRLVDYAEAPGLRVESPPAGEAVVVFLRPDFMGHGVSAVVYDGEEFLSVVMADSHYVHRTTAGAHRFMVVSEAADFMDAELGSGQVYFAEVDPRMGWWRARFSLIPLPAGGDDWDELDGWLEDSYEITPNDKGREWAVNNHESVLSKKAEFLEEWLEKEARPALGPGDGVPRYPE